MWCGIFSFQLTEEAEVTEKKRKCTDDYEGRAEVCTYICTRVLLPGKFVGLSSGWSGESSEKKSNSSMEMWREMASSFVYRSISLKSRGRVNEACVIPVILHGAETWAVMGRVKDILIRYDKRMLSEMAVQDAQ